MDQTFATAIVNWIFVKFLSDIIIIIIIIIMFFFIHFKYLMFHHTIVKISGPSCSKLTTSLVNDLLKFTSSDTQICWSFLLKKNVSSFCTAKATHIFPAKISEYCMLNPLKQLMKWPLTSSLSWRRFEQLGPEILNKWNLLKTCIQTTYPIDFCIICSLFLLLKPLSRIKLFVHR